MARAAPHQSCSDDAHMPEPSCQWTTLLPSGGHRKSSNRPDKVRERKDKIAKATDVCMPTNACSDDDQTGNNETATNTSGTNPSGRR
jgi:hypothetical protein